MKRNLLLLFICFLKIELASAQTNTIDSLKQLLQNEKRDSSRSRLLAKLSKAYIYFKPDTALLFAQQGLGLAKAIQFIPGKHNA